MDTKGFSFFEVSNRVHYREIPLIRELGRQLDQLVQQEQDVVMFSRQAGMVAYHVFREFYGDVRFIDGYSLSSRELTDCPLSRSWGSGKLGLKFYYARYLDSLEELEHSCGVPRPDVIFDLDLPNLEYAKKIKTAGYTIVFKQTGPVQLHEWPRGAYVLGNQFIAVKNDLLGATPVEKKEFQFKAKTK